MGKIISKFVCHECGYETPKWLGKCPGCSAWNSLLEESISNKPLRRTAERVAAIPLNQLSAEDSPRFSSGLSEFDRVLGGGIVPGSLILLGGDPGIGKSTLLLQVAGLIAAAGKRILYLSGEESLQQIRLRASRLGINNDTIFLLNEQDIDLLHEYINDLDPDLIIIDSIQTVYSSKLSSIPGSVSQLRESTAAVMQMAKKMNKAVFLVGHVTKDGSLAGPKVLEHIVDVVVYFEGEKNFSFRLLRAAKNRFGATDEIALLEMSGQGLVEVPDPSYVFLSPGRDISSGTAIVASMEGSRPLLIEIQALVSSLGAGYPRRMVSGIDQNRLSLIIAVLEKRRGYTLSACDVYLKVSGGVFLKDPSVDLGIAAAVLSSYLEKPLAMDTVFIGEISLSGQIRPVSFLDLRLREIDRMGYKRVIVPTSPGRLAKSSHNMEILEVKSLDHFIDIVLEG